MSLNWNIEKVKNYRELCYFVMPIETWENLPKDERFSVGGGSEWYIVEPDGKNFDENVNDGKAYVERMNPVTNCLIWAMFTIGQGDITEKTRIEIYNRLRAYEKLRGSWLRMDGKDLPFTQVDVDDHIGLTTNVGTETRAQFYKRCFGQGDFFKHEGFTDVQSATEACKRSYGGIK